MRVCPCVHANVQVTDVSSKFCRGWSACVDKLHRIQWKIAALTRHCSGSRILWFVHTRTRSHQMLCCLWTACGWKRKKSKSRIFIAYSYRVKAQLVLSERCWYFSPGYQSWSDVSVDFSCKRKGNVDNFSFFRSNKIFLWSQGKETTDRRITLTSYMHTCLSSYNSFISSNLRIHFVAVYIYQSDCYVLEPTWLQNHYLNF